jgi:hypothetical protein
LIAALPWLTPLATAQAPSSIAGSGLLVSFIYGTYPLASYGYSLFLPANSGNSYQFIGIYAVTDATGTYLYAPTSAMTGQMSLSSSSSGDGVVTVDFITSTTGSFDYGSTTYPGLYQGGAFVGAIGTAPSSVAGKGMYCTVADGLFPFASNGSFLLSTASEGFNLQPIVREDLHQRANGDDQRYSL